jgi:hypothetical protein
MPVTPAPKTLDANTYITVQKIIWEVPDYLSYSSKYKDYLNSAGKSIKLSLSSDLLLATEYPYNRAIRVDMDLDANGNVKSANAVSSSGSAQIDNIVLQSVKETLNVVKPPVGEVKGANVRLSIIIYL